MITRVKIGIFPILIAYWSGFEIFKQNRDNPDEIGMVGQSENVTNRCTASKHGMYVCTLKICATTIPLRYKMPSPYFLHQALLYVLQFSVVLMSVFAS